MEIIARGKSENNFWTKKRKDSFFIVVMLAIPVLQFLIFWVYVNFKSILMAFQDMDVNGNEYFTLKQFTLFFRELSDKDSIIYESVKNTLIAFVVSNFISFPLSILLGYFLFKKVPLASVYRIVFFIPSIVSSVVLVMVFKYFIQVNGPFDYFLIKFLNISPEKIPNFLGDSRYAFMTIQIFEIWGGLGYTMIIISGAIYRIPEEIFESGKLDGVGVFREFFQIVIPLTWSTLTTYIIFRVAGIFCYTGQILLFTKGNYGTFTIGYFIFSQVKFDNSFYYPSAVGLFFTVIGIPIILGVKCLLEKISDNIEY